MWGPPFGISAQKREDYGMVLESGCLGCVGRGWTLLWDAGSGVVLLVQQYMG